MTANKPARPAPLTPEERRILLTHPDHPATVGGELIRSYEATVRALEAERDGLAALVARQQAVLKLAKSALMRSIPTERTAEKLLRHDQAFKEVDAALLSAEAKP